MGAVAVNRSLTVEPAIEMGVHQGSTRQEVLLVPNELLEEGTAYTFTLHAGGESYSWVFETKESLHVTQIRPQDSTVNVACTSHIEIVLDKLFDLDLSRVEEYVHISPQVSGSFHQNGRVLYFIPDSALQPGTVYTVSVAAGLPVANSSVCLQESYSATFETAPAVSSLWYVDAETCYPSGTSPSFMLQVAPSSASATEIAATAAVHGRVR